MSNHATSSPIVNEVVIMTGVMLAACATTYVVKKGLKKAASLKPSRFQKVKP